MTFPRLLSLTCLLLGFHCLPAQSLLFLDASQWYLTEVGPQGSSFDWYQTGKDSTINGRDYLQASVGYSPLPIWVREEADSQRVYVTAPWNGWNERLLYDFSLQMGDTTELDFRYGGPMRFVVDNIDAVNSTQGFIPRLNLRNLDGAQPAEVRWTPGVGAFTNPFYLDLLNQANTSYSLICNYHDNVKLWDDGFGNCPAGPPPPVSALGEEAGRRPRVSLRQDRFVVEAPAGKPWEIEARDVQGKLVWEGKCGGGNRLEAGSGWTKGLYILRLWSGGRVVLVKWMAM